MWACLKAMARPFFLLLFLLFYGAKFGGVKFAYDEKFS